MWAAGCSAAPAGGPSLVVGGSWPPDHVRRQLSRVEHARRVRTTDAGVDPDGDGHEGDGWSAGELRRAFPSSRGLRPLGMAGIAAAGAWPRGTGPGPAVAGACPAGVVTADGSCASTTTLRDQR